MVVGLNYYVVLQEVSSEVKLVNKVLEEVLWKRRWGRTGGVGVDL